MGARRRPIRRLPARTLALAVLAPWSARVAQERGASAASAPDGHARMFGMLAEIAVAGDDVHPFLGTRRVEDLRARWAKRKDGAPAPERWLLLRRLGRTELEQGNELEAIALHEAAVALLDELPYGDLERARLDGGRARPLEPETYYRNLTWLELGVAYLRSGETENCCRRDASASCILPLQGAGLHAEPAGSRGAIRCFEEVLRRRPAEPDAAEHADCEAPARWLLNVAYMTLGEHPARVPEAWRLALDDLFPCAIEFPRFTNVMPALRLDTFDLSGGVIVDDFDGDEHLDVLLSCWDTRGPMRFFRNERDGTFTDRTAAANLTGFTGGLNMWQADYDDDGDLDVVVPRGAWLGAFGKHPTSLFRNDGRAVFTDVALDVGLAPARFPGKTGAWSDTDLDGDLDLYLAFDQGEACPDAFPQLYRNDGDGTFTERAAGAGLRDPLFAMGVSFGDYDEDRYPDLFVGALAQRPSDAPSKLYHNERDGTFRDVTREAGLQPPGQTFPSWFWDFDDDGHLDLYVSCRAGTVATLVDRELRQCGDALYKGDGRGRFVDVAHAAGLTHPALPMGANFGDLNGDGRLDLYLGTGNYDYSELHPNVMYLGLPGGRFANVTMKGGFGHLQKGHGVAFADLDADGDQDVWIQMGGAFRGDAFSDALFENPGFGNHWLELELEGVRTNRSAIGARIRVDVEEDGRRRALHRHVTSGGSFGSSPLRQNIGLGHAEAARVEILWPVTGTTQVFEDVPVDRAWRVVEGEDELVPVFLTRSRLGGRAAPEESTPQEAAAAPVEAGAGRD